MTVLPFERRTVPAAAGPADLAPEQVKTLLAPINPSRVQNLRGQSHLEAWDIRRWLNRVFGFGGWSDETLELVCVSEREINPNRWTVIYRAQVRLTVKTADGRVLSTWDDAAMGDSRNQPALGDAHDQAMKTALSQALKRCAVNLGDAFGLSLYNDGSRAAVGLWSAAHLAPAAVEEAPSVPDDEPVKPEPAPQVEQPAPAEQAPTAGQQAQQRPGPQPAPSAAGPSRDYLADAEAAESRERFDQVRAAAVAEGAPQDYLDQLDAIARRKDAAAQQRPPRQQAAPGPRIVKAAEQTSTPERDLAVADLLATGKALGLSEDQVEEIVRAETGAPVAECTAEQLAGVAADLRAAVEEVAA